jgi:5S rRNA maturation endonuclease (ribonuclease M5)
MNLLSEIEVLKDSDILIIVEGAKDKKCLESLGFRNVIELRSRPLYEVVEIVSQKCNRAAILTDLDKKGKQIFGYLSSGLQKRGVSIDNRFRNFLYKNTNLSHIEGLASFLEKSL